MALVLIFNVECMVSERNVKREISGKITIFPFNVLTNYEQTVKINLYKYIRM